MSRRQHKTTSTDVRHTSLGERNLMSVHSASKESATPTPAPATTLLSTRINEVRIARLAAAEERAIRLIGEDINAPLADPQLAELADFVESRQIDAAKLDVVRQHLVEGRWHDAGLALVAASRPNISAQGRVRVREYAAANGATLPDGF